MTGIMTDLNGLTATGALVLLACGLAFTACWLIDRTRTERVVFTSGPTVPGPGMCGCGAPKCTPPPAPFPGDRAAAGAAFLDEHAPGWLDRIVKR